MPLPVKTSPTERPVVVSTKAGSYVVVTATGLMIVREIVSGAVETIRPPSWRITWLRHNVICTHSVSDRSQIW